MMKYLDDDVHDQQYAIAVSCAALVYAFAAAVFQYMLL